MKSKKFHHFKFQHGERRYFKCVIKHSQNSYMFWPLFRVGKRLHYRWWELDKPVCVAFYCWTFNLNQANKPINYDWIGFGEFIIVVEMCQALIARVLITQLSHHFDVLIKELLLSFWKFISISKFNRKKNYSPNLFLLYVCPKKYLYMLLLFVYTTSNME